MHVGLWHTMKVKKLKHFVGWSRARGRWLDLDFNSLEDAKFHNPALILIREIIK